MKRIRRVLIPLLGKQKTAHIFNSCLSGFGDKVAQRLHAPIRIRDGEPCPTPYFAVHPIPLPDAVGTLRTDAKRPFWLYGKRLHSLRRLKIQRCRQIPRHHVAGQTDSNRARMGYKCLFNAAHVWRKRKPQAKSARLTGL
ncbi:hypothetical protein Amal_04022 [Acetobacter malorum]|uniref:Uncharacterized protein n=1 Tax=Acetobacter malorum TaxID=178901 RepID=A0A177FXL4_9PROT|nr:hypothetical protein Amal_04022 [Acetobacter malorum]